MKMNKNELLKAIKTLDLILNKTSQGIGACIYFDGNNILSSNDGMIINVPFKTDFKCFISPEKIIKYLEKVKQDEIDISFENNILKLKDKKAELMLKSLVNIKDVIELKEYEDFKELPNDFYRGLEYSLYSSTNDLYARYNFLGYILFNENKIFSTNNKKLGEYTFDDDIGTFTIYSSIAATLLKIPDIISFKLLENKIIFKTNDNTLIYCEIKKIKFPDYEGIIQLPKEVIEIDFIDCLIEGIDFCEILNQNIDTSDKIVNFKIIKNKLTIFTETLEGKIKYNYKLNREYENDISFVLEVYLIKEIIKQKDFKCYFNLNDNLYFVNDKYRFVCQIKK